MPCQTLGTDFSTTIQAVTTNSTDPPTSWYSAQKFHKYQGLKFTSWDEGRWRMIGQNRFPSDLAGIGPTLTTREKCYRRLYGTIDRPPPTLSIEVGEEPISLIIGLTHQTKAGCKEIGTNPNRFWKSISQFAVFVVFVRVVETFWLLSVTSMFHKSVVFQWYSKIRRLLHWDMSSWMQNCLCSCLGNVSEKLR